MYIERLYKFNLPIDNYNRVCRDVLVKNSINPKITLNNYTSFGLNSLNKLFQIIWNESVKLLTDKEPVYFLNIYLTWESMKTFKANAGIKKIINSKNIKYFSTPGDFTASINSSNDPLELDYTADIFKNSGFNIEKYKFDSLTIEEQILLNYYMTHPLNIDGVLDILSSETITSQTLLRISEINKIINKYKLDNKNINKKVENIYVKSEKLREKKGILAPYTLILLVEGTTEETLLPVFSKYAGIDFAKKGVKIISSGGKNQVARIYEKLSKEVNIPIFIIMDSDAEEISKKLTKTLRKQDAIHLIKEGEFEDILNNRLICRSVNSYYKLTGNIKLAELSDCNKKSYKLQELWKEKGFGEFKKVEFAKLLAENIKKQTDISPELLDIFEKIKKIML